MAKYLELLQERLQNYKLLWENGKSRTVLCFSREKNRSLHPWENGTSLFFLNFNCCKEMQDLPLPTMAHCVLLRFFNSMDFLWWFEIRICRRLAEGLLHKMKIATCTQPKWPNQVGKGQVISKCLFSAIVSTKKPTKFFKEFLP